MMAVSKQPGSVFPATAQGIALSQRKPALADLGLDLLRVSPAEKAIALVLPFGFAVTFLIAGWAGWWPLAMLCAIGQCFFTYASVSHDLVHRTLGLPRWLNEWLLCLIEVISFRSGHAFRATHLQHHARYPSDDDIEGRAAALPWWQALATGVTAQLRWWRWAVVRSRGAARRWMVLEGWVALLLLLLCLAAWPWTAVPAAYAAMNIAGSWIFPFMTSYMPHNPHAPNALTQTRLFRGRVLGLLALEHLYHLEHHLYPQVPHQRWPDLARRLDAYFADCGLRPIVLWR